LPPERHQAAEGPKDAEAPKDAEGPKDRETVRRRSREPANRQGPVPAGDGEGAVGRGPAPASGRVQPVRARTPAPRGNRSRSPRVTQYTPSGRLRSPVRPAFGASDAK